MSSARTWEGRGPGQAVGGDRPGRRRGLWHRYRVLWLLVPVILVAAAAVVLAARFSSYRLLALRSHSQGEQRRVTG
jgi:hypothetical protein